MTDPGSAALELPADAFSLTPDPARVFASQHHTEALARLRRGLEERRGLMVAVAEVGMGKTTLAYTLLSSLGTSVRSAYVANTRLSFEGLLQHALDDFGVHSDARDRAGLLAALGVFVEECAAWGELAVLVVDEAQSLEPETFEALELLLDLGTAATTAREFFQLILLGQPELDERLREPRLERVAARIAVRVELDRLDGAESRRYVEHRLAQSGASIERFTGPALDAIVRHARGVPRRMNILCHNALLLAYAAGEERVSRAMVDEAFHELTGGTLVRVRRHPGGDAAARARRRKLAGWCAAGVAAAAMVALGVAGWRARPTPLREAGRSLPAVPAPAPPANAVVAAPSVVARAEVETAPAPAPSPEEAAPPPIAAPVPPVAAPRPVVPSVPPPRVATAPVPRPAAIVVPAPKAPPPRPAPAADATPKPPPAPAVAPPPRPAETPHAPAIEVARATPSPSEAEVPPAMAPEPPAAPATVTDADVHALLDRYARAWESGDIGELRRIGQVADDGQAQALARYFGGVHELDVEVRVLATTVSGEGRTVRFTRRDRFRDPTGREVSQESPPIEKTVVRAPGGGLRFAPRS